MENAQKPSNPEGIQDLFESLEIGVLLLLLLSLYIFIYLL
jgi:hypothetical protein